jgi:hypothetical protein
MSDNAVAIPTDSQAITPALHYNAEPSRYGIHDAIAGLEFMGLHRPHLFLFVHVVLR